MEDKAAKKSEAAQKEEEAREKFIKAGSQLKLNCYLRKATEPPSYIFWYHNKTMVNYSPQLGKMVHNHADGMGSTLTVKETLAGYSVLDYLDIPCRFSLWGEMMLGTTRVPHQTFTPTL